VAVNVPPPQLPVALLGLATATPEGRSSVKPTPVMPWAESLLVIVNDSVLVAPLAIELGENELEMVGALAARELAGNASQSTPSAVNSRPLGFTFLTLSLVFTSLPLSWRQCSFSIDLLNYGA
jgi:hypothetical protein